MLNKISASLTSPQKAYIKAIAEKLFEAEITLHIYHLEAKSKNGWEHTALGSLYEALPDLADDLIEKSYAVVGSISGYKNISTSVETTPVAYVRGLFTEVSTQRMGITTPYIQQIVDNILDTIAKTIYQLDNVK